MYCPQPGLGATPWGGFRWPSPMSWLRSKWANLTGLPARLQTIENAARAVSRDPSRSREDRNRGARLATDVMFDRAEVQRILRENLRQQDDGLGALPVLLIVGGASVLAVATTLVAIFGRVSTYDRELRAIERGSVTPAEVVDLRRGAETGGGVAATLRETGNLVKIAMAGAAAWFAWKQWG